MMLSVMELVQVVRGGGQLLPLPSPYNCDISSNDSAWKSFPSSIVYCDGIYSVECIRQEQNPAGIYLHCDMDVLYCKLAAIISHAHNQG